MQYAMTIDGELVAGDSSFEVVNPATEQVVGLAPACSREQLDAAFAAARSAGPAWAARPELRRQALGTAAARLREHATAIAPVLTAEQGKPLRDSTGELAASAAWLDYYTGFEDYFEIVHEDDTVRYEVTRRPVGVVAAIAPWNAPILLAMWKISAALAAGSTVVLKPSPFTPLSTLAVGAALRDCFPPGVLNIVSGPDPLGVDMVTHPVPGKVALTGSVSTGKAVAVAAARDLKRVTLELGGNDPAIVMDDADIDAIADRLYGAAFANAGQICEAIKRVYVPEALYRRAVTALSDRARAAVVGNGMDPSTQLGPLTTPAQRDLVEALVHDARSAGAAVLTGGRRGRDIGYFFEPTVVGDIGNGTALVDDEQFGPALPVVTYRDINEVVDAVNGSHFGLTASVWSGNVDRARAVADALEVGRVKINGHGGFPRPDVPFGGTKWSGMGVENGRWGLEAYTELHVTQVQKAVASPATAAAVDTPSAEPSTIPTTTGVSP